MTAQTQPEALRLANRLDADATDVDMGRKPVTCTRRKAAAELRRQHAEIQQLNERLRMQEVYSVDLSCSLSGHGILIHGDSKSIARVKSALHAEFETVPTLREEIRVLRQKLGSSKRRVKKIEEDSNLEAWALEGQMRWLQEKENTSYQGCV